MAAKKYMTVGMLEDELVRFRNGLNEVIKVLKAMDRRELVTTIEDPRIGGKVKPYACPAVGWDCAEKIWRLKATSDRRMTKALRKAMLTFLYGVTPCLVRITRYVENHTEV